MLKMKRKFNSRSKERSSLIQLGSLLRKGLNLEVRNEVELRLQQVSSHAQPLHGQILGSQLKIDFYVVDCDIWHLPMTPQHLTVLGS